MKFIVSEKDAGLRLDQYLSIVMDGLSRSQVKKKISEHVLVNSKKIKASLVLKPGDEVEVSEEIESGFVLKPEEGELNKIFEDDHILIINKPAGLLVHPAGSNKDISLASILISHYKNLPTLQGEDRPGIVHRLDRDTSGIMILVKTREAQESLIKQFKERAVQKKYLALVFGIMEEESGEIAESLGRGTHKRTKTVIQKDGREALTLWKLLEEFEELSFLELSPRTGRTHQLRIHLQSIGHPILGDEVYMDPNWLKNIRKTKTKQALSRASRHMLHAWEISFLHPISQEKLEFKALLPDDFKKALSLLDFKNDRLL